MKSLVLAALCLAVPAVSGCGGADPPSAGSAAPAGADVNPDGVPYPSPPDGYGRRARSGGTPGSVMANFKFRGYPGGDASRGLRDVSLADYYDPCNRRYRLIHLTVAAVWCQPCFQETDAIVAARSKLEAERVVVLQALDDGPVAGTPATPGDLDYWVKTHRSNFTELLDPGLQNLSGFFDAASIPWNADLDPRTMEILDASEGWSGDVGSAISPSVLPSAPSTPSPVECP